MKKVISVLLSFIAVITLLGCTNKSLSVIEGESKIVRLYIGEEGQFNNSEYSYVTDNSSVLQIEGNRYRGLKEGSASVTVKSQNEDEIAVYLFIIFGNKPIELQNLEINDLPVDNNVTVGQVEKLSYSKYPANADKYDAIVWQSSDPSVLSIDRNGNMQANKMGQATLTVSALGTNVKQQVTINVLPRDTVFKINLSKLIGIVGQTEQLLVADVLCDYPITREVAWFTEDESIVRVNNGELTFVKEGKTNVGINARINEQEYVAKCEVTVCEDLGYTVIRTPEQLQEISNASANYMLGNDIDMAKACAEGGSLYNEGKGFMPLFENAKNSFKGIFEGNGFAIRNIMINRINDAFVALMRYISAEEGNEGLIRNLSIIGGSIKGGNYTTVFYANSSGYGSVNSGLKNCYAELDLQSLGSLSCLVGNNKGVVENCITKVTFDALTNAYLFALNHTLPNLEYGVKNCVYIGSETTTNMANLTNGGSILSECFAITLEQVPTFNFNMGDGWNYTAGAVPTIKGV